MSVSLRKHAVGDVVVVNPEAGFPSRLNGKRFVITDTPRGANGVNYKASPCDADGNAVPGQGLRGPAHSLVPFADSAAAAVVTTYVPNHPLGAIVRPKVISGIPSSLVPGLYVVTGETDHQRVRIVRLGGDGGRYFRAYSKNLEDVSSRVTLSD